MINLNHSRNLGVRRAGCFLSLFLLAHSALATTISVTVLNDGGPGSLRVAIAAADAGDTIIFDPSLMGGTITLTNGELLITNNLTLIGPGAAGLAISGNQSNRVFEIGSNAVVSISGLTIRDGHAANGPSGSDGGGIYNQGTLNLSGCAITNNSAGNGGDYFGGCGGDGGGVYNANTFQATACTISGNQAGSGGITPPGMAYSDGGWGGGIYNSGMMRLTNCTLSANRGGGGGSGYDYGNQGISGGWGGGWGGGIANSGAFALVACTVSADSAGSGGSGGDNGFYGAAGGSGGWGGGIFNFATQPTAELLDTLVGSNSPGFGGQLGPGTPGAGPDLAGPFTSLGYNLIGQTNGCTGFTNGINADLAGTDANPLDPLLGPLANNGGPTLTMALLHGSPALAAGDDGLLGPPYNLATDQRGFPRNAGAHMDIGAFQFRPIATPTALISLPGSAVSGFQLVFTNTSGATLSVLTATNPLLPLSNWTVIGQALELAPGQFQFTAARTTNDLHRFYRVSSP